MKSSRPHLELLLQHPLTTLLHTPTNIQYRTEGPQCIHCRVLAYETFYSNVELRPCQQKRGLCLAQRRTSCRTNHRRQEGRVLPGVATKQELDACNGFRPVLPPSEKMSTLTQNRNGAGLFMLRLLSSACRFPFELPC